MKSKSLFPTLLLFISFIISCSEDLVYPNQKGDIYGYIQLIDKEGNPFTDYSNVTVSLRGSINATTKSEKSGRFVFKETRAGSYDLEFEKEGFENFKILGVSHLGGASTIINDVTNSFIIGQKADFKILQYEIEINKDDPLLEFISVKFTLDKSIEYTLNKTFPSILVYVGENNRVSSTNYLMVLPIDFYPSNNQNVFTREYYFQYSGGRLIDG